MDNNNLSRRPRFFGPATMIALVVIAAMFVNSQRTSKMPAAPDRPAGNSEFRLPGEPDAALILKNKDLLGLSSDQVESLQKLLDEWKTQVAPIERKMKKADAEAAQYMNSVATQPRSIDELMKKASPVSEASAEYVRLKEEYQKRTIELLTKEQKTKWEAVRKEELKNEKNK